jgi:hypothetical protein
MAGGSAVIRRDGVFTPEAFVLWSTTILGALAWAVVTVRFWPSIQPVTLVLGTVMVLAATVFPLDMPQGSINLASAGFLAALLAAGPATALAALGLGSLAAVAVPPGNSLRHLFNTGNFLLSLTIGWLVAHVLGLGPAEVVVYTLAVLIGFTVVNHGLIGLYYQVVDGVQAWRATLQAVLWDLLGWLVTLPMAWMFYALGRPLGHLGEALVVVPFGALAITGLVAASAASGPAPRARRPGKRAHRRRARA